MYSIVFSPRSRKQFKRLERSIQLRIRDALKRIRIRPHQFVIKLVGEPGYRLRVGQYRVIMDIHDDELFILVIKVGHRKNIYK